ncbi:cccfa34f-840c-430e-bacf-19770787b5e3 [Thermothielavioides terrestris]
MSSGP